VVTEYKATVTRRAQGRKTADQRDALSRLRRPRLRSAKVMIELVRNRVA